RRRDLRDRLNPLVKFSIALAVACLFAEAPSAFAQDNPLAIGVASHAFDHLGDIGDQAPAAAASGANIIYSGGVGVLGYQGLPPTQQLDQVSAKSAAYLCAARASGIKLAIGYVCATSIVKLDTFDQNWTPNF